MVTGHREAEQLDESDVLAYLECVARELRLRDITVRSVAVRSDRPVGGRLEIVRQPRRKPAQERSLVLVWQDNAGWTAVWPGKPGTWPHIAPWFAGHPDAAPAVVACLVSDILTG